MKFHKRYLAAALIILLVLLLVVLFSASSWLETEAGRQLLQRELSKALGMDAELQGKYSLKIFPSIQIAGNDLVLSDAGSPLLLASVQSYELNLALKPLFKKQIDILKVSIRHGVLDLDRLSESISRSSPESGSGLQLPRIRDLQVLDLRVLKTGEEIVVIKALDLSKFAENQKAEISMSLAFPAMGDESELIKLAGLMVLTASPFQISFDVDELTFRRADMVWPVGTGTLNWLAEKSELKGSLNGSLVGYSSQYEFTVQTAESLLIEFLVELESSDNTRLMALLRARDESDRWLLESIDLDLAGQKAAGSGCMAMSQPPVLQVQLHSSQLDMDVLQDLLPAGLFPADSVSGEGSGEGVSAVAEPGESDWPVQLAILLQADEMMLSGANARNARILLGSEPDCDWNENASND